VGIPFDELQSVSTAAQVHDLRDSTQLVESPDKVGVFIGPKTLPTGLDSATGNDPNKPFAPSGMLRECPRKNRRDCSPT
jgi:hypothetical protein